MAGVSIPYPGASDIALVARRFEVVVPAGQIGLFTQSSPSNWYLVPPDRILVVLFASLYTGATATSSVQNPLVREAHLVESWVDASGNNTDAYYGMMNGYGAVPGSQYPVDYFLNGPFYIPPGHVITMTGWYSSGTLGSPDALPIEGFLNGYTIPLGNTNLNG